ncbi:MAG: pyridoxamine kinase [Ruminococcaceae bacterium]|nr:pyridoxamine kinase [Oscillospiraceae bacterium]
MQHLPPRRIAAIHDFSCVGRCALTVVIPTLSVMGYQTIPLPTALLSSHTGGFEGLYFRDLTADMHQIAAHFDRLEMTFGSIYTGFLGSVEQISVVREFIERFGKTPDETGKAPLVLVDPVMGDDGVLYATYTKELADGMRELGTHAEVLTPNLTEACFLTDTPYKDTAKLAEEEVEEYVLDLLEKLSHICHGKIVVTGIGLAGGIVANAGRDDDGRIFWIKRTCQDISYPGTGDIFASVLLGALMQGDSFETACTRAADFIVLLITESQKIDTPVRMGVALEAHLGALLKK